MLEIVEPTDHAAPSRTPLSSVLFSIFAHGLLALVLWCLVSKAVKSQSISLIATLSAPSGDVTLELATKSKPIEPVVAEGQTSPVNAKAAIESFISTPGESDSISESIREDFEPASIEFFGTRAYGNRFVFVIDISYSMKARRGERFTRACDELLRSVSALRPGQSYYVFAFCWDTEKMFYKPNVGYVEVRADHVSQLRRWIYNVSLGAGTDPRRALALAHQMKPDAVFLLSDGHFNEPGAAKTEAGWIDGSGREFDADVQDGVEILFADIPIHTVAFENPFTLSAMQNIAAAVEGSCRYVPTQSHQPIDSNRFLSALRHIDQKHRHDRRPREEYVTRLAYAREFIRDGELVYAEYLVRPLRHASKSKISNPLLLDQILTILETELGGARLEDFEPLPELSDILGRDT